MHDFWSGWLSKSIVQKNTNLVRILGLLVCWFLEVFCCTRSNEHGHPSDCSNTIGEVVAVQFINQSLIKRIFRGRLEKIMLTHMTAISFTWVTATMGKPHTPMLLNACLKSEHCGTCCMHLHGHFPCTRPIVIPYSNASILARVGGWYGNERHDLQSTP